MNQKKRDQVKDERRNCLLEAARHVFGTKGYYEATVDDITKAAGVAKGTFYLYFSEKQAIFYELIGQFFELVTQIGMSVSEEVESEEDYFIRLEIAAKRLAKIFKEHRDLVRLTYRESMGMDAKLESMIHRFYRKMAEIEAANIRLGMKLGFFRTDLNPILVAYAHIGMVERVLLQWVFDKKFPEIQNLVNQLIELGHEGLRIREAIFRKSFDVSHD
jgi:AcrR family transcriptional regulator